MRFWRWGRHQMLFSNNWSRSSKKIWLKKCWTALARNLFSVLSTTLTLNLLCHWNIWSNILRSYWVKKLETNILCIFGSTILLDIKTRCLILHAHWNLLFNVIITHFSFSFWDNCSNSAQKWLRLKALATHNGWKECAKTRVLLQKNVVPFFGREKKNDLIFPKVAIHHTIATIFMFFSFILQFWSNNSVAQNDILKSSSISFLLIQSKSNYVL